MRPRLACAKRFDRREFPINLKPFHGIGKPFRGQRHVGRKLAVRVLEPLSAEPFPTSLEDNS